MNSNVYQCLTTVYHTSVCVHERSSYHGGYIEQLMCTSAILLCIIRLYVSTRDLVTMVATLNS